MSTNCISCIKNERTGSDLLCDECRKAEKCKHQSTHYLDEPWPDGGAIELCDDCGMSRHHWEQGESGWVMIRDLDEARKQVQAGIDRMMAT